MTVEMCQHPGCEFPVHGESEQPHGQMVEAPGTPCRICSDPVPLNGDPCQRCWVKLDDLPLADVRALFAADGMFDTAIECDG